MKMRLNSGWTLFTLFCHEVVIENYEIAWEIILGLSSLFLISFEKRRISISTIVKLFFFFKIGKGEIFLINNLRLYSYFCIMGWVSHITYYKYFMEQFTTEYEINLIYLHWNLLLC